MLDMPASPQMTWWRCKQRVDGTDGVECMAPRLMTRLQWLRWLFHGEISRNTRPLMWKCMRSWNIWQPVYQFLAGYAWRGWEICIRF